MNKNKMKNIVRCHVCNAERRIHNLTPAERIKHWREAKELTQDEMGEAVGKNRQWVANLEGNRPISATNAKILANFFNVSLDLVLMDQR